MLAQRVGTALTVGTVMIALALVVILLLIGPHRWSGEGPGAGSEKH
jgi:hypothetical protein